MKLDEFLQIMKKVSRFKARLAEEGINEQEQDIILKIYIKDITSRINTSFLEVI